MFSRSFINILLILLIILIIDNFIDRLIKILHYLVTSSLRTFSTSIFSDDSPVTAAVRVIHDKSTLALSTPIPNLIHLSIDLFYSCSIESNFSCYINLYTCPTTRLKVVAHSSSSSFASEFDTACGTFNF